MIYNFKDFENMLNEHAIYNIKLSNFDIYFEEIQDDKKTMKNFKKEMLNLKELLRNINIDDIDISNTKYKDRENYIIEFGSGISSLIDALRRLYNKIQKENEKLIDKINDDFFDSQQFNLEFDVQIGRDNFNKFHFPIDLPKFLKGIGLGKKIIQKTVDVIGYCMFSKVEDSIDLKFVVESIVKDDKSRFSFMKDRNLIIVKDDYQIVEKIVKEWYSSDYDFMCLDEDFHIKYKENIEKDEILNKLYSEFKKKYLNKKPLN